MAFIRSLALVLPLLILCQSTQAGTSLSLRSPEGRAHLKAGLDDQGRPWYSLHYAREKLLSKSRLGLRLKKLGQLRSGFSLKKTSKNSKDEEWKPLWGEDDLIRNHYREARMSLLQKAQGNRRMDIVFRLYDDGLAFHYHIPEQAGIDEAVIVSEDSEFAFPSDPITWWIPNNYDTYEMLYRKTRLSEVGVKGDKAASHTHSSGQSKLRGANTPITMRFDSGLHLSIHEARLIDYGGMTLVPQTKGSRTLVSELVPWPNGDKVRFKAPFRSPWRTIQFAENAGGLVESKLILNLNDPCKLEDTSYIEAMKYIGIWWSMHLGIKTWGMKGGRHGASTEETKRYIDFAAKNGIKGVLVEGWNTGWESWYSDDNFDFYTQYPDFDLEQVCKYAKSKGVEIIGHHETGGQIEAYEKNLHRAFALYKKLGIRAVKTGYAGKIRPKGIFHHGPRMDRHYKHVMETAARYGIMIDAHEPIKDTGLRRSYPNMMTREGVRGMEWNAWSKGNPPEHHANLVFTRMLSGPLDYTPGIFDLNFERYGHEYRLWNENEGLETKGKMSSTLAKQLALYVVFYSPMQMAADLVENYEGHPAFQFIRDVDCDWSKSLVLNGEVGDFATIARRAKNSQDWFIGAISDEKARRMTLSLDFLNQGQSYHATFYRDSLLSHYRRNPLPLTIERRMVEKGEKLSIRLAPGGGQAIHIRAISKDHP